MAGRAEPLAAMVAPVAAALAILALVLGTLAAVILRAETPLSLAAADLRAIRFTLLQALISALASTALAIPVARALARRAFYGRNLAVLLMGAPFVLPVIVAVFGLLFVFGRNGLLNGIGGALGLPPFDIYGLQGVVLAHVFFNLPLATRLLLHGWAAVPTEHFRMAAMLGFTQADLRRHIEVPMRRPILIGAFLVILALCLSSFAVALTLGGGPAATTVELAIYQAFRYDFDLGRAGLLAVIQFGICIAAAGLLQLFWRPAALGRPLGLEPMRWDLYGPGPLLADILWIGLAALLLLPPLGAVVAAGLGGLGQIPASFWPALLRSLAVATGAVALVLVLALALVLPAARGRRGGRQLRALGYLTLAASPLVIGTGAFIVLQPFWDPARFALIAVAATNAAMALPFALRVLAPTADRTEADFGPLADSLSMNGLNRLRYLALPAMRRPLGFAAGLTAALAMGDLGVITLFADPRQPTLPMLLFQLMGAYRMQAAAAVALLLAVLALGLFRFLDKGIGGDAGSS